MTNIQKSKFSKISNLFFLSTSTFFISFVWINYYLRNIKTSLLSSIIITCCFIIIYILINHFKNIIANKTNNSKTQLLNLKIELMYSTYNTKKDIIANIYKLSNITSTDTLDHFVSINNQKDFYFLFNKEIITEEDLLYIYNTRKYNVIDIFCIDYLSNLTIIDDIQINIQNLNNINSKVKENNLKLDYSINVKKTTKRRVKDIICVILNRTKSKNYFLWGVLLLIFSVFTPYYLYYNIIGSILLLLSLYSRFNKKFN